MLADIVHGGPLERLKQASSRHPGAIRACAMVLGVTDKELVEYARSGELGNDAVDAAFSAVDSVERTIADAARDLEGIEDESRLRQAPPDGGSRDTSDRR